MHNGHIAVAQAAIQHYGLDLVYMVPNSTPPHKHNGTLPHYHRYAMVTLACQDDPKLVPTQLTTQPYTYDEVFALLVEHPTDKLFFIMGIDSLIDLPNWKHVGLITGTKIEFIVSERPGYKYPPEWFEQAKFFGEIYNRIHFMTQVWLPITATDIRAAIENGEPISKYLLNPTVINYINKTGIYK